MQAKHSSTWNKISILQNETRKLMSNKCRKNYMYLLLINNSIHFWIESPETLKPLTENYKIYAQHNSLDTIWRAPNVIAGIDKLGYLNLSCSYTAKETTSKLTDSLRSGREALLTIHVTEG